MGNGWVLFAALLWFCVGMLTAVGLMDDVVNERVELALKQQRFCMGQFNDHH